MTVLLTVFQKGHALLPLPSVSYVFRGPSCYKNRSLTCQPVNRPVLCSGHCPYSIFTREKTEAQRSEKPPRLPPSGRRSPRGPGQMGSGIGAPRPGTAVRLEQPSVLWSAHAFLSCWPLRFSSGSNGDDSGRDRMSRSRKQPDRLDPCSRPACPDPVLAPSFALGRVQAFTRCTEQRGIEAPARSRCLSQQQAGPDPTSLPGSCVGPNTHGCPCGFPGLSCSGSLP